MSDGALIAVLILLIALSAYFSATETAFSGLNKIRLKNLAAEGDKKARLAYLISGNFDRILSTILIGNHIVTILCASLATVLFTRLYGGGGAAISTAVVTVAALLFGEITPKSLAREAPEKFAMLSARFLKVLMALLAPLSFLFGCWKKLLSKLFKQHESAPITEEDLITYVSEAESEGGIEAHESELIRSAIEFNDLDARDILTPRVNIVAVDMHDSLEEIRDAFFLHGYSRLPVYNDTMDHIIGAIHEKDFFKMLHNGQEDINTILQDVIYIPPTTKISRLLLNLQQTQHHVAVIVDEFGGTMGLVTLEDILEELVGDIWDEHDEVVEPFTMIDDCTYRVSGDASIKELFDQIQVDEPIDARDPVTVGGWIMQELGRIPDEGDSLLYQNLNFTVKKIHHRQIEELELKLPPTLCEINA